MKHIGWFILDKDGISHHFIPKRTYFFGAVIDKDEFTDFDETLHNSIPEKHIPHF